MKKVDFQQAIGSINYLVVLVAAVSAFVILGTFVVFGAKYIGQSYTLITKTKVRGETQ